MKTEDLTLMSFETWQAADDVICNGVSGLGREHKSAFTKDVYKLIELVRRDTLSLPKVQMQVEVEEEPEQPVKQAGVVEGWNGNFKPNTSYICTDSPPHLVWKVGETYETNAKGELRDPHGYTILRTLAKFVEAPAAHDPWADIDPILERLEDYSTILGWIAKNHTRLDPTYIGDVMADPVEATQRDGFWLTHTVTNKSPFEVYKVRAPQALLDANRSFACVNAYPDEYIEERMRMKGRILK